MMDNGGINIVALGADPTGQTDTIPFLQQAFAASRLVYAPPGSFGMDGQFNLPSGCRLYGGGAGGVTTFFARVQNPFATLFNVQNAAGVTLSGMTLDGANKVPGVFNASSALNLRLENIEMKNATGSGPTLGGVGDFYLSRLTINTIGIGQSSTGGQHGISIFDCDKGTITQCHIDGTKNAGINISHSTGIIASSNVVRSGAGTPGNPFAGIRFTNMSERCAAIGNMIEGYNNSTTMNGKAITFSNNVCIRPQADAIHLRSGIGGGGQATCDGMTVNGNTVIEPLSPGAAGCWIYATDGLSNNGHTFAGNSGLDFRSPQLMPGFMRNWGGTNVKITGTGGNVPENA